jgi:hypothetical protein
MTRNRVHRPTIRNVLGADPAKPPIATVAASACYCGEVAKKPARKPWAPEAGRAGGPASRS